MLSVLEKITLTDYLAQELGISNRSIKIMMPQGYLKRKDVQEFLQEQEKKIKKYYIKESDTDANSN